MSRPVSTQLVCAWAVIVLALVAGVADAATVWNPAGNGIVKPDTGDWNATANWTNGLPGVAAPDEMKAVFNVPDAADAVVIDAQSFNQFVQGDNGPGGVIRVQNGGSLTTGPNWSAVGYNSTAHMIVETGGSASVGDHMWVGYTVDGVGTLDINGGTVNVAGMIGLGWEGGTGYVNVNDGLLNLSNIHGDTELLKSIQGASVLDIEMGAVTLPGDFTSVIDAYIDAGKITGYGVVGNAKSVFADEVTTVTAPNVLLGDVNGDGVVNGLDVDPFVGLVTTGTFQPAGDMNGDGAVNGLDVDPFVAAVVGGGVQAVPEPSSWIILVIGALLLGYAARRQR